MEPMDLETLRADFAARVEAAAACDMTALEAWLRDETDFFTAPASTRFHGSFEGGLVQHSINVADRLSDMTKANGIAWQRPESPIVIGLLHDLCKCNFYTTYVKNVKVYDEKGSKRDSIGRFDWKEETGYAVDDRYPYGHGEKSVLLAQRFVDLTDEEIMCVRWHMGAYEDGGKMALASAMARYPNIIWAQTADLLATYVDEA